MTMSARKATVIAAHVMVAICVAGVQTAGATQQFATQTGESCGQCHVAAKGAGPLTPAGQAFKANGNKLPKDKDSEAAPAGAAPK
jgi:hypothetical protein